MNILFFCVAMLSVYTFAQSQTVNDADFAVLEKIYQANIKQTGMISDFEQVKHISLLGEDTKSNGKLYYSKPEKMALWFTDPRR